MTGKRKANEAGSSNGLRADVLCVLGVLKVATADQIQRLASPHLTYRHTLKKTAAVRKEARTASHRGAANDLRRHGLSVDGGRTRGGEEVRLLTAAGLAAAAIDLDREPEEMGGMPKSAGRSGASHPMTVNEAVIALIRPVPDLGLVAGEPAEAVAAAQAAVDAPKGIGTITSYATEVALPVKGTWKNPAIGSARADVVVVAPGDGVPLLFLEVDNCTEEAVLIAAKFDKYMRFFKRREKDTDGIEKPMWRTRWSAPASEGYERVHPPVLLVFHQLGKRSTKSQIQNVADLTRDHWEGRWHREEGFHSYDGCIPVVATTLELLPEHGPAGPAFWRFVRDRREPLLDAIGNPRREAALARRRQAHQEQERRREEQEAAEREARRPVCTYCGQKFSDDRWTAVDVRDWSQPRESHPYLCEHCRSRAVAAERQAEADERERQEQERFRQEVEAEQASRKASGWLGRWRP
ncbi:replication-relaxation family protein [Streptomyces sp. WI04-05B]|uniref:replication-relaxation family protein n=1 Tax=Streptomyces TaxID=1883 RepID=UPI0029B8CB57|nr:MULTISPECIES: replication-relaxation family protein [unclassified Streptomyces]MDX2546367.1 replication-relaxation family protein [Streptomyces sp. WI04-05B]MDX2589180.1 replication-relaxation family protein [Streptomyces sp. WI04-05A]